eukprot:UN15993
MPQCVPRCTEYATRPTPDCTPAYTLPTLAASYAQVPVLVQTRSAQRLTLVPSHGAQPKQIKHGKEVCHCHHRRYRRPHQDALRDRERLCTPEDGQQGGLCPHGGR